MRLGDILHEVAWAVDSALEAVLCFPFTLISRLMDACDVAADTAAEWYAAKVAEYHSDVETDTNDAWLKLERKERK